MNNDDGEWRYWELVDGEHVERDLPGIDGTWTFDHPRGVVALDVPFLAIDPVDPFDGSDNGAGRSVSRAGPDAVGAVYPYPAADGREDVG